MPFSKALTIITQPNNNNQQPVQLTQQPNNEQQTNNNPIIIRQPKQQINNNTDKKRANLVWKEFSFFSTNTHTKIKEHSLTYYLPIARQRKVELILFPRLLAVFWIANSLVQDLNSSRRSKNVSKKLNVKHIHISID